MTDLIAWQDDLDPAVGTAVAGAKMGRLSELSRIGLNVPRGFTVTTAAYRRHCSAVGLEGFVEQQLSTLSGPDDHTRLEDLADAIRKRFEEAPLEPALSEAIGRAYDELCYRCSETNQPVAVRSSAVGEDSAQASFAGMFDTYLGMSGPERVREAVRRCWASRFTSHVLSYQIRRGIAHDEMQMAVGVVELVHARTAGVAFSVNPVTADPDRIVIEGSWGWGEAVVQGAVTPDHIEVDKADRRVVSNQVAHKRVVSAFDYERGEVVLTAMPERFRDTPILDQEEIDALAELVCGIEKYYQYPVDIEWVISRARRPGDPVSVVQARPISGISDTKGEEGAVDRGASTTSLAD